MLDIEKICADTLAEYPRAAGTIIYNNTVKKMKDDYKVIDRLIERKGLDKITADYKMAWNEWDDTLMEKEKNPPNFFSVGPTHDEYFFKIALWANYNKAVVKELEAVKGGGQKDEVSTPLRVNYNKAVVKELEAVKDGGQKDEVSTPRAEITADTFIRFFNADKKGFDRVILALLNTKMIEKNSEFVNGYKWLYDKRREGKIRKHGICAMWYAAKDAELIKDSVKNNKTICEAIRVFFGLKSLAHTTLDDVKEDEKRNNKYGDLYEKLFAQMVKKQ